MRRLIGVCIAFAAGIAAAHEGTDPLAVWYRSLKTVEGKSCCAMHDCAGRGTDEGRPLGGLDFFPTMPTQGVGSRWRIMPCCDARARPADPLPHAKRIYPLFRAATRHLTPKLHRSWTVP